MTAPMGKHDGASSGGSAAKRIGTDVYNGLVRLLSRVAIPAGLRIATENAETGIRRAEASIFRQFAKDSPASECDPQSGNWIKMVQIETLLACKD